MPQTTVDIGITTYADISTPKHAAECLRILTQTDPRLTPEFVGEFEPINTPVDPETWSHFWSQDGYVQGSGARMDIKVGGRWRRKHAVQSYGSVDHTTRQSRKPASDLQLTFRWHKQIDWTTLFDALCAQFEPAYGMMHLFTPPERKRVEISTFDGPIVGEGTFLDRLSPDGNVIKLDQRKRPAPMRYSYLPELSWANFFGSPFDDLITADALAAAGGHVRVVEGGTLLHLTPRLDDVLHRTQTFDEARQRLRDTFPKGTFRAPIPMDDPRFRADG